MHKDIELFRSAILIRRVEETLLKLFQEGHVNGTIHTCVGQEFSAIAFCKQLKQNDFIFSNHRCHGHYVAFTGDYVGLIHEVMGKSDGVCGGVGGSQHLCANNFFSNGIQGGIVPVAAGMALADKLRNKNNIGVVFIGDGTLGEGVVYEVMNIISKWQIPLLIVMENNFYAQSTSQDISLAGNILDRPKAFGIKTFKDSTRNYSKLIQNAQKSIEFVRLNQSPAFHQIDTYRLEPHSKGDDYRDKEEIKKNRKVDPIHVFSLTYPDVYKILLNEADSKVDKAIEKAKKSKSLQIEDYLKIDKVDESKQIRLKNNGDTSKRLINEINSSFHNIMEKYENTIFIGEDILSPYGGTFKATENLSDRFPDRVFSTPISEAAIVGIANGLALKGFKPFVELMFGDFITLAFDQIVNHASKFFHMYNKKISCPIIIRTPMGGKRGYGPTHSQSLEKFLIGIDNVKVIALNNFIPPQLIYETIVKKENHPVIVIENKGDYSKRFAKINEKIFEEYSLKEDKQRYPLLKWEPSFSNPNISIVTYGGNLQIVLESVEKLFFENEILSEIIVLTQIHPLCIQQLNEAIKTSFIFVVEEGSKSGSFGSEVICSLIETRKEIIKAKRINSYPVPIPASKELENQILCNTSRIVSTVLNEYLDE